MTRSYLVVFEKTNTGWSAFAPDVPGTGGLGDRIEDSRQNLRKGIGYMLEDFLDRNEASPEAATTSIDFSEFDPDPSTSHYVIEWLSIELPSNRQHSDELLKQAA